MKRVSFDASSLRHLQYKGKLQKIFDDHNREYLIQMYFTNAYEILRGYYNSKRGKITCKGIMSHIIRYDIPLVFGIFDNWFDDQIGELTNSRYKDNFNKLKVHFNNMFNNCIKNMNIKTDIMQYDPTILQKNNTTLSLLRYREANVNLFYSIKILEDENYQSHKIDFGRRPIDELTPQEVCNEIKELLGISPRSIDKSIEGLRKIYRNAEYPKLLRELSICNMRNTYRNIEQIQYHIVEKMLVVYSYLFELIIYSVISKESPKEIISYGSLFDADLLASAVISETDYLVVSDKALYRTTKYILDQVYDNYQIKVIYYDPSKKLFNDKTNLTELIN